jgi:hypothetical protein
LWPAQLISWMVVSVHLYFVCMYPNSAFSLSMSSGSKSCWWCDDCCWNHPTSLSARTLSRASGGSCSMGVLLSWWLGIHRSYPAYI